MPYQLIDQTMPHTSPDTSPDAHNRWYIYDALIAGIPEDICVTRLCMGAAWTYVEAECGMGVAMTCFGGARQTYTDSLIGKPLRKIAALSKSWNFGDATIGVAALNAWYSRRELLDPLGALYDDEGEQPEEHQRRKDAFSMYASQMKDKNVCVVGHFPHVEHIATEHAGNLIVLERNCTTPIDTPDPACEYVMYDQDFLFMTGITLTNKTMTRLLELGRMNSKTRIVLVGPSVVPSTLMFNIGVECLAGSIVVDPEGVRYSIERGSGRPFGSSFLMFDCFRDQSLRDLCLQHCSANATSERFEDVS